MASPYTFISYAREDAEFVLGVAAELRQKGVSIWLDKFDIHPGDDWNRAVDAALEGCECFLLVVSPSSIASDNVMDELAAAVEDGKRIVPLLYQSCRMPLRIRRLHYIDFTAEYTTAMGELINALAGLAPAAEKPAQPKPEPKKPVQKAKAQPPHENFTEDIPGGVKLEMVAIPGGSFMMGSDKFDDEKPIHKVAVKPFHMGKYEVTQAQWKAVMGNNPSKFKGDDLPVETVSWNDAQEFCKKLSRMTGKKYRLPTEAEWEYACRAGSTGKYCFGDDESLLKDYAWYSKNSDGRTHPVGQKKPNAWGLYDMHGNVWEWCEDGYDEKPGLRGGSWDYDGGFCRSAYRDPYEPGFRDIAFGFRVVVAAR